MSKKWLAVIGVIVVLALVVSGFMIWAQTPLGPMPEALAALESDSTVRVETDPWFAFWPQDRMPTSGVIDLSWGAGKSAFICSGSARPGRKRAPDSDYAYAAKSGRIRFRCGGRCDSRIPGDRDLDCWRTFFGWNDGRWIYGGQCRCC